jgi:hypothetical protein
MIGSQKFNDTTHLSSFGDQMLWILLFVLPLIVLSNVLTGLAYAYPDSLKNTLTQPELIQYWVTLTILIAVFYAIACFRSQFNTAALWMALPCIIFGAFLIGYGYAKLGPVKTFFGRELGIVSGPLVTEFPFSLGHPQYKGAIILILGIWFAFKHNLELTIITGLWIVSVMVQLMIEAPPAASGLRAMTQRS